MGEEKNFETRVKVFLEHNDAWFFKVWGNGIQRKGLPDIIASVSGNFFGIEIKAKSGKPSDLQLRELHEIDCSGGFALLLYPEDFEDFKNFVLEMFATGKPNIFEYQKLKERWERLYDDLRN